MTHRQQGPIRGRRWFSTLLTWQNGLRLLGAGGFVILILSDGPERIVYMVACLALATFGLPGAIRFDRERQKERDPE